MNQLSIRSNAFEDKALIPVEYTGYGDDISPELILSGIDDNAKSIAIIMDDMGHPIPAYNHWVIWNIPVQEVIPAKIPHGKMVLDGAVQGIGYGKHRYRGPKPPFNWSHEYQFNVYILDTTLQIPDTSRKRALLKAIQGHILQHGILSGHYR